MEKDKTEKIFRSDNVNYLQHGYQPTGVGGKISIMEGYVPAGKPITGQVSEPTQPKSSKGGSVQQDK